MKTVTIITTTRNRADFFKRAAETVLAQDYPAIEHVVVDAKSSDNTVEIIKQLEPQYRAKGFTLRWVSEPDSGLCAGLNKGFRLSTGEYVTLLHDDDQLEPGAIKAFVEAFSTHPDIDFVYGDHYEVVEGRPGRNLIKYRLFSLEDMVRNGYQVPQPSFLCKRTLLEQYGAWDESMYHVADHDLFIRFALHGVRFLHIPFPMQTVEIHAGRTTRKYFLRTLTETKMVNFKYGGGYFSRFYVLYLRDRYFSGFFDFMRDRMPGLWGFMKKIFNVLTGSSQS
jgi:glycosyltransferase involved in cell wall biosynthesis